MRSRSALSTARSSAKLDTVLPWDIEMAIEDPEDAGSEDAKTRTTPKTPTPKTLTPKTPTQPGSRPPVQVA